MTTNAGTETSDKPNIEPYVRNCAMSLVLSVALYSDNEATGFLGLFLTLVVMGLAMFSSLFARDIVKATKSDLIGDNSPVSIFLKALVGVSYAWCLFAVIHSIKHVTLMYYTL